MTGITLRGQTPIFQRRQGRGCPLNEMALTPCAESVAIAFGTECFSATQTCGAVRGQQTLALCSASPNAAQCQPENKRASARVGRSGERRHCAGRRTQACVPCATGPAIAMPVVLPDFVCVRGFRSCGPS